MQKRRLLLLSFLLLALVSVAVWALVIFRAPPVLTVAFLDIGQGDAILIEGPTGIQMLVDGGRDRSVLRELGKQMGLFDRSLDLVVETHPDADHIGGLPDVFARYQIGAYLSPGIEHTTMPHAALVHAADVEPDLEQLLARRGMRIDLGGGAYADVLYPDTDVTYAETNSGSVVLRVVYGQTAFLLTGDAPEEVEEHIISLGGDIESEVLKAGHHGSRTSTGDALLGEVLPEFVVISAGKENSYGHPHEEVLARIAASGARVLSTLGSGAVVLVSDGAEVKEK